MYEDEIKVEEENLEDKIDVKEENVIVNTGGTTDHSKLRHLDFESSGHTGFASFENLQAEITARQNAVSNLQNNKQDKLVSGTNIKTINNNSILGSGDLDIEGGYPEINEQFYRKSTLLAIYNDTENIPDGIYVTTKTSRRISIRKEDGSIERIFVNPKTLVFIDRDNYMIAFTGATNGIYFYVEVEEQGCFNGGYFPNSENVEALIDAKLGPNVVMTNTDQTISGQKKFTSTNGTIFENGGGTLFRYIYSSPAFKIIPDNIGNIDFYYNDTLLGRIDANNSILYRGVRPNLNETVDLGTSNYNFNKIYTKSLVSDATEKFVANLVSSDSNLIPVSDNLLSIGNTSRQWHSLYLANTLRFDPQSTTKLENLKNLTVNTINLGQQRGGTTLWGTSKFLQYDSNDVKCKGKLYAGLDVNNQAIHNIPDPDNDTSPISKGYADTNYQGTLTAGTGIAITNNVISSTLEGIDYEVDQELPATGEKGIIYLIPNGSSETENIYDEYIWIPPLQEGESGRFEFIGTTQTDLTNYVDLTSAQTISGNKTFSGTLYALGNISDGTNSVAVADIADKTYVDTKIGDIDTALQNLVSGNGVI